MASPVAISAVIAQTTNAQFQAWVNEVITALVTTCGLTQTTDTGQINPATVSTPGAINTSQGYVILRFNDTLQSTSPIFIKLEFGSAGAITTPQMWVTMGQGSNGSGTLTGTLSTRVATGGVAPLSTSTAYTSRYFYNATIGAMGMVFKQGSLSSVAGSSLAGFFIARSTDNSGTPISNGAHLLSSSNTATAITNSQTNGYLQSYSYSASAFSTGATNLWLTIPSTGSFIFGASSTIQNSIGCVAPCWMLDPVYRFFAQFGVALLADFPLGNTSSYAMIGSTPINFISVGTPFGSSTGFGGNASAMTFCMPWQ